MGEAFGIKAPAKKVILSPQFDLLCLFNLLVEMNSHSLSPYVLHSYSLDIFIFLTFYFLCNIVDFKIKHLILLIMQCSKKSVFLGFYLTRQEFLNHSNKVICNTTNM